MLEPGDPAPAFDVLDHTGKRTTLASFAGKTVVLWFYPMADTPGCTAEGCLFRDLQSEYAAKNAQILGISFDAPAANKAFVDKFGFQFPLLCDTDKSIAIAYGAADSTADAMPRRAAAIIDPNGNIKQWLPKVAARSFPTEALQLV